MKLLIIKRDKLGDLLLATPLLAHVKAVRPQLEVHLLANDYNAWVVEGNANIDRLWVYRRVRHAGRIHVAAAWEAALLGMRLRREQFDWVIAANGEESPRAIRLALRAGARRSVAYCSSPGRYAGLTDPLAVDDALHESARMLKLLSPLGISAPRIALYPEYALADKDAAFARRWLGERGLAAGRYVVIGLGARRAKKQPAPEQVLRWSAHCRQAWGLDTVFMWTPGASSDPLYPGDDAIAQPVLDARAAQLHAFRGPVREALGLIWGARASVFPDSGLMHFAAVSPGGVLGLFAETDVSPHPRQWGPLGPKACWLEAQKSVAQLPDALVYEHLQRLLA